jgi:hypothetical protein
MRFPYFQTSVARNRRRTYCVEFLEGRDLMSVVAPVSTGGPPRNPSPPIIVVQPPTGLTPGQYSPPS